MNVLKKDVPLFDQEDINGSLKRIYDFLSATFEEIDYTLSRHGIQLGKVNLPATAEKITELEGKLAALGSRLDGISQRLGRAENHLLTLDTDVEDLKERVTALENPEEQEGN